MGQFTQILKRLKDHEVQYLIIGGVAAALHGSPMGTIDLDVCISLDEQNLRRVHAAMQGINARFRMRPDKMRLFEDAERLLIFKNIYLDTDLGMIDLLGEVPGIGTYPELADKTVDMDVGGFSCRVLGLDTLIAAKRHAGRDKDIVGVRHLESVKQTRQRQPGLFDDLG